MLGLVSIIIPFYKKKKFIKNTIDSVANQTYRNYEVIFVYDDPNKEEIKNYILISLGPYKVMKRVINTIKSIS